MKTICFLMLGSGNTALLSALNAPAAESVAVTALASAVILAACFSWRWLLLCASEQTLAEVWITE